MAIQISSGSTDVSSTVTISEPDINQNFPRVTVAISYYDDATLDTPSASPVGDFAVEGITQGGQSYTAFANSPIDASESGTFASAASPLKEIRVTPSGVSGTSYYQVTVTSNRA